MTIGLVSIPSRNHPNPYLKLFYQELEKYGFEIHDQINFCIRDIVRNRDKIDVLHFHWFPAPEENIFVGYSDTLKSFVKLILVRLMGIKIIWTAHNLLPHDSKFCRLQFIRRWLLVRMCNVIIVHFERAKDILHSMFQVSKQKMICIHHGLYDGWYLNSINPQSARISLNIPMEATVFLCFGNIKPYKNIENLIKGFKNAAAINKQISLLLAGNPEDDKYRNELLELIADHPQIQTFFENIPDSDVQRYFNAANCCIFPYKNVFTSGASLLAITFRRPVIMKKCDFFDEYFLPQNSLYLNDFDAIAIKEVIEGFYRNRDSFIVTEEFFSYYRWENIVSKTTVNKLKVLLGKNNIK